MNDFDHTPARYCFGDFVLDLREVRLTCAGEPIDLTPKEFETLRVLVTHAGHLVPKEELIRQVWPDTFVSDSSLLRNISVLRKHLGHDCIRTVSKRGYLFARPVALLDGSGSGNQSDRSEQSFSYSRLPETKLASEEIVADDSAHEVTLNPVSSSGALHPNSLATQGKASGAGGRETTSPHFALSFLARRRSIGVLAATLLVASIATYFGLSRVAMLQALRRKPEIVQAGAQENAEAARLCELAWFYRNKDTASDVVKAIGLFRQAVQVDPSDPRAWGGLADSLIWRMQMAEFQADREAGLNEAELAAQRGLALGPNIAEAHLGAGTVDWQAGDVPAAEREYRRAIAINPTYAEAQYRYAILLAETGRQSEAKVQYDRALQMGPASARVVANAATLYAQLGLFDQALQLLHRALDMNEDPGLVDGDLGQVLMRLHRYREAANSFQKVLAAAGEGSTLNPETLPYNAVEAYCLARAGHPERARSILRNVLTWRSDGAKLNDAAVAVLYAGLDDKDSAIQWLGRALASGTSTQIIEEYPAFESLHNMPAFQQLIAKYEQAPVKPSLDVNSREVTDAR